MPIPPASALTHPGVAVMIWFTIFVSTMVHEVSHGFTCRHYGGPVKEMGIGFMLYQPLAYADVTGSYLIQERWKRMLVLLAGNMGGLFTLSILLLVAMLFDPQGWVYRGLYIGFVAQAIFDVLFNFVPFIKLDGYFMLTELTQIQNLRQRSFELLVVLLRRHLLGESVELPEATPYERRAMLAYGVLAALFMVGFYTLLALFFYRWLVPEFRGYGLFILFILVGLPVLKEAFEAIGRTVRKLLAIRHELGKSRAFRRTIAIVAGLLVVSNLIQTPLSIDARFVIEPAERHFLRAPIKGQVLEVKVQRGQQVTVGQEIARLENRELELDRMVARAELAMSELEVEILKKGRRDEERNVMLTDLRAALARAGQWSHRARRAAELPTGTIDRGTLDASREAMALARGSLAIEQQDAELFEAGARPEDLAAAQARVDRARSVVTQLDADLEKLRIVSPAAGIILEEEPELLLGRVLEPGELLLTVQSADRFRARLVPAWIDGELELVGKDATLVLESGQRIATAIARAEERAVAAQERWMRGDVIGPGLRGDAIATRGVFESAPFASTTLRAGLTGDAEIIGPPVSIFRELLWMPLSYFFSAELWSL